MSRWACLSRACSRTLMLATAVTLGTGMIGAAAPAALAGTGTCVSSQPPAAPTDLRVVDRTADSVTLAWHRSTPGSCPVGYYELDFALLTNPPSPLGVAVTTRKTSATVTLREPIEYLFTVEAFDVNGDPSAFSNSLVVDNTVPPPSATR